MDAISTVENHNYIPGPRELIDSRQTSFMRENVRYIVSLRSKNLVIVIFKHKLDFKICQCS